MNMEFSRAREMLKEREILVRAEKKASKDRIIQDEKIFDLVRSDVPNSSTGDRQLDLAIMTRGGFDKAAGEDVYKFERQLQQHPGELAVLIATRQESLIKYCFPVGRDHLRTYSYNLYLIGQLSKEPKLSSVDSIGQLKLPFERFVVLKEDWLTSDKPITAKDLKGFRKSVVSLKDADDRFFLWTPVLNEDAGNYFVGNASTAQRLLITRFGRSEGNDWIKEIFRAFGFKKVDYEGGGLLNIPATHFQ